jgi:large subunit ribosomal protein L1
LERRGKYFRKSSELIEKDKFYKLEEAIGLAQKTSHVKFDATVELHVRLGVDPRHADQNIRDNLVLPAGTGKSVKIAVLTDDAAEAKKAGADIAGTDDLFAELDKGTLNFDILIATPALMAKLGKYARVLGPRGLMPNPKSGTVTTDIAKAVAEAKAGRVEYRVDTTGIVHLGIGKVSFTAAQLLQNLEAVLASVKANKPQSVKGNYLKAVHLSTSMGPSIAVDLTNIA